MGRFAIELIKGDDRTFLEAFDTKEAAFAAGRAYRQKYSPRQGLIGCICAELDENNQADFNYFRICQTWF